MIRGIILIVLVFFIGGVFLFNLQNYQELNFYREKFWKEHSALNNELFLLKEITINLEKFRLFFEPIYLEEMRRLMKESRILEKESLGDSLLNNLGYLISFPKIKKNDLIIFTNFREWLKEREKILKEEQNKLTNQFLGFQTKKIKEIKLFNMITILGLSLLVIFISIFLTFRKKENKFFNNYFSLLELLKIVKEKTDKYLEMINSWEGKTKKIKEVLSDIDNNWKDLSILHKYKRNLTYSLLNIQLGLLNGDSLLINKYFPTFKEIGEKITQLVCSNEKENLINYFREKEEEFALWKEELNTLKKMIDEIKSYEIKK